MNKVLSTKSGYIKVLIDNLSNVIELDDESKIFLTSRLDKILKSNILEEMINTYTKMLIEDMGGVIALNITPGIQFGIQNKYFTVIGYYGSMDADKKQKIDENTYFSFDSISKILTSIVTLLMIRDGRVRIDSKINDINNDFITDTRIEDILKFRSALETDIRIDNLNREDTIRILKNCRENLVRKNKNKNYYQYSDIGYMILRLSIPLFMERLNIVLNLIDSNNLTINNIENRNKITGGKKTMEYMTPDPKGRDIPFPGHTGLYGNIEGLLNLFEEIFYTNKIITKKELDLLISPPYKEPYVYNGNDIKLNSRNKPIYTTKVGGVYHKPQCIEGDFDKILYCDVSNLTTDKVLSSIGTCGSWIMGDDLNYNGMFRSYVAGILTNPYSFVEVGEYPDNVNVIPNSPLTVNKKGVIIGYPKKLEYYKEVVCRYGIILELLTEYLNITNHELLEDKQYKLKIRLKNN